MKELLHYAVIDLFTGDELAVVEAKAIIEQKLNVGYYQFTGVFVDGAVQFLLYQGEDSTEHFHFLGGEMQCLGTGVAEKFVTAYISAQCCAVEKVGMERQSRKLGKGNIWVRFHFHNLSRSETSHGHLVEVVGSATVREPAPLVLLEINGINSVVHHTLLDVLRVLNVHYAYQRMKRFHPLIFIEVLYGIEKNILHNLFALSRLSFSSIRIVGSIDLRIVFIRNGFQPLIG